MKHYPGIMFEAWPGSIEIDGDTAVVRSYTSEVYDQGELTLRDRGVYEDTCVKRDGKWLFKARNFRNIHRQQAAKSCLSTLTISRSLRLCHRWGGKGQCGLSNGTGSARHDAEPFLAAGPAPSGP